MCARVIFHENEVTKEELKQAGITCKNDECELSFQAKKPILLVEIEGKKKFVEWGNRDNPESKLPKTGWARKESVEKGKWTWLQPIKVKIIANKGFEKGIWFKIKEGINGLLVTDEKKKEHVYMITEQASHYFQTMTRHDRMPSLINERL